MPFLVFVLGAPAVGKSNCAKLIAKKLGAAYLDKDTVVTGFTEAVLTLAGTDPDGRDENPYYQDHVMDLEYETILRIAADNLRLGLSVVLDAPFGRYLGRPDFLSGWSEVLEWGEDVSPVVVHVDADGETIRERMTQRGLDRDSWKLAHWDEYWASQSWSKGAVCRWKGARQFHLDNSGSPETENLVAQFSV